MDLLVRRVDKDLPLPEYKTEGAVALDLYVREGATIAPKALGVLPLNVSLRLPAGHLGLMAARSSLWKRGLMLPNSVGIFDEDYAGDGDEYRVTLYNFTDEPVTVERGERLVQLAIIPYDKASVKEVDTLGAPDRGGYGTTGL